MNNLEQMALEATKKNLTTKKSKLSICDHFYQMLYVDGQKLDRDKIMAKITMYRVGEQHGVKTTEKMLSESIESGEFKKLLATVKNGVDQAVCNGKTSANFVSNKRYADYELIKEGNQFSIIKK